MLGETEEYEPLSQAAIIMQWKKIKKVKKSKNMGKMWCLKYCSLRTYCGISRYWIITIIYCNKILLFYIETV
jgi:hypothetical protein